MKIAKRLVASHVVFCCTELDINTSRFSRGVYSTHDLWSEVKCVAYSSDDLRSLHYTTLYLWYTSYILQYRRSCTHSKPVPWPHLNPSKPSVYRFFGSRVKKFSKCLGATMKSVTSGPRHVAGTVMRTHTYLVAQYTIQSPGICGSLIHSSRVS
jgi:hypothetical protein